VRTIASDLKLVVQLLVQRSGSTKIQLLSLRELMSTIFRDSQLVIILLPLFSSGSKSLGLLQPQLVVILIEFEFLNVRDVLTHISLVWCHTHMRELCDPRVHAHLAFVLFQL
jgi:hypothetical protein